MAGRLLRGLGGFNRFPQDKSRIDMVISAGLMRCMEDLTDGRAGGPGLSAAAEPASLLQEEWDGPDLVLGDNLPAMTSAPSSGGEGAF